jgi:D-alanine-D-alanine ligase
LEIIPPTGRFFDYQVKYDGSTQEIPVAFFGEMLKKIKDTARVAHRALGCRHYSRTDMIVKGTNVYVLEVNTLPGMTKESLLPKAAAISRIEFPQLLEHIISQAIYT